MTKNNVTRFAIKSNNVAHSVINYVNPNYFSEYNEYHSIMDNDYQAEISFKIPLMTEAPDFMHSHYMFDEYVDICDENREHKIDIIRNMMKAVFE